MNAARTTRPSTATVDNRWLCSLGLCGYCFQGELRGLPYVHLASPVPSPSRLDCFVKRSLNWPLTLRLVAATGYDRLALETVAAEAKSGKATI